MKKMRSTTVPLGIFRTCKRCYGSNGKHDWFCVFADEEAKGSGGSGDPNVPVVPTGPETDGTIIDAEFDVVTKPEQRTIEYKPALPILTEAKDASPQSRSEVLKPSQS
jgi:hypothetical protein